MAVFPRWRTASPPSWRPTGADLPGVCLADSRLTAIEEALGDAETVALWLHENVHLDMPPEEAVDLLGTLAVALGQDGLPPNVPLDSLLPVKQKLLDAVDCESVYHVPLGQPQGNRISAGV